MAKVRSGLDALVSESFKGLKGRRVGLIAHPASVDRELRPIWSLMMESAVNVVTLFGPEHGLLGHAQDMAPVFEGEAPIEEKDPRFPKVISLYGSTEESLFPKVSDFEDLDVVVIDLQDVGARYYTFQATMGYALQTAAQTKTEVWVLDRPNPIACLSSSIEGPRIEPGFESFVSAFPMPIRHGLTIGELAFWIKEQMHIDVELCVIKMEGYHRAMVFDETGLPWVLPSPNMPTLDTALVYPGQCLWEGTTLSEGRGTTRPFEIFGAPFIEGERWLKAMEAYRDSFAKGVRLRALGFEPTFQKHAKKICGGLQIHITNRQELRSVGLTVALFCTLQKLYGDALAWREEAYEFVQDRLAIDLLFGSDKPRKMIESGANPEDIVHSFQAYEDEFREERRSILIYDES